MSEIRKTSEAHRRASAKWNAKNDAITLRVNREIGDAIRAAAAAENLSMTQFVLSCVRLKLEI